MGKITALDTAWNPEVKWTEVLKPCMEHIDFFMPSYEEAAKISGEREPEKIADVFIKMGVKVAVIKLGKDGCFIKSSNGEKYLIPAYKNVKLVDTTGAGDAFCAGFLTGLSKDWSLYECGKFGNAAGSHSIMEIGASTGIKPLEEIKSFMLFRDKRRE